MVEVDLMRMEEIKSAFQNVFSEVLIWKQRNKSPTKSNENYIKQ